MDHESARELMAAAVEGSLDAARERDLAIHLVGCADCKSLYSRLQQAEVALRGLAFSHPPGAAVDAAVARATRVLHGEADPGPGSGAQPQTVRPVEDVDIAPSPGSLFPATTPIAVPAPLPSYAPAETAGPVETDDDGDEEPALPVQAILGEPDESPVAAAVIEPPSDPIAALDQDEEPPAEPERGPVSRDPAIARDDIDSPGARPYSADIDLEDDVTDDLVLRPLPPRPGEVSAPPVWSPPEYSGEPIAAEPSDFDAAPIGEPPVRIPVQRTSLAPAERRRRAGPGRWLAAITAAVVLALVAGFVITRSQTGGGATPTVAQVRQRVQQTFAQLRSLKASFTIRRLDLYPVSRSGAAVQYSFSDGTTTGRLVFDRTEGFREESATDVNGNEVATTRVAQTVGELRTLQGSGASSQLVVSHNPPLGPPDGQLHPELGSLDRAVGSIAQMLVSSPSLDVLGLRKTPDGQVVDVRFDVVPTELSRADRIDVSLDARTYFPIHVQRQISRANGRVLAPESILGGAALQTAFGNRDRILTEDTVISDLVVNDVILPGDFVLDVPQGAATRNVDGSFQRVSRAEAAAKLHFPPLYPQALPSGFTEQSLAVFTGTPSTWGPNGSYPAPDGILQGLYFDGKTTIVIAERHMPHGPFDLHGSPITGVTLPIQVTSQTRADKTFFYASSPEVPPHAFGFLGDVYVMAAGYAPADELVGIVASMAQLPGSSPAASAVATATP
jgi:hypothetical protein